MSVFSENLRRTLDEQGRTKAALARHLGVDAHRITDWCRDKGAPTPEQLVEISRFLQVDTEALLAPADDGRDGGAGPGIPIAAAGTAGPLAPDRPPPDRTPCHVARFQSGPFLVELKAWRVDRDPFEEEGQ